MGWRSHKSAHASMGLLRSLANLVGISPRDRLDDWLSGLHNWELLARLVGRDASGGGLGLLLLMGSDLEE